MKTFSQADLINFLPQFDTFVGIDSDGCVFDTMEIKQKDFFHPAIIKQWKLEAIEPQVRATAEFTYLYSTYRGLNRFLGLCKTFELLNDWPEARNTAALPNPSDLRTYCDSGLPLSNETLLAEAQRTGSILLAQTYQWSTELNEAARSAFLSAASHSDYRAAIRLQQQSRRLALLARSKW